MFEREFSTLLEMARAIGSNSLQPIIEEIGNRELQKRGDYDPSGGRKIDPADALQRIQRITEKLQDKGFPVEISTTLNPPITRVSVDLVRSDANPPLYYGDYIPVFAFNISDNTSIEPSVLHARMLGAQHLLTEVFGSATNSH